MLQDVSAAIEAFRVNVEAFPESANAWDSLGEGLAEGGETAPAIRAYERSLELDPSNTNATERLRSLRGG